MNVGMHTYTHIYTYIHSYKDRQIDKARKQTYKHNINIHIPTQACNNSSSSSNIPFLASSSLLLHYTIITSASRTLHWIYNNKTLLASNVPSHLVSFRCCAVFARVLVLICINTVIHVINNVLLMLAFIIRMQSTEMTSSTQWNKCKHILRILAVH